MKSKFFTYAGFIVIMVALGASDCLKGLFGPLFQEHFRLNNTQLSMIITVSYIGNVFFLLVGGHLTDKYRRKTTLIASILIWMSALLLFLLSDSYLLLLVGIFFALGASTLTSTNINVLVPLLFTSSPAFAINALFFTQGIGTSGSQSVIGNFATDFSAWKTVNFILLILGCIGLVILLFSKIPDWKKVEEPAVKLRDIVKQKAFLYLSFIMGFYFIAEHGIMNWLVTYGTQHLHMKSGTAANYLAIFFGAIMLGRLLLSPLVDRWGPMKSIRLFSLIAAALYIIGILFGEKTILLLSISGFFMSIVYPTLLFSFQLFFPKKSISTVTGMIISVAYVFDIVFNLCFGKLIDWFGYGQSILILPVGMAAFAGIFYIFSKKHTV